jgi:hypothetical protein
MVAGAIVRGLLGAGVLAGLLFALPGCAGAVGQSPADTLAQAHAGIHVYHRPAPEIAAAVRAELAAEGFSLDSASDDRLIATQWSWPLDEDQLASQGERYVVLVRRLTAQHCRVEAMKLKVWIGGLETYHPLKPATGGGSRGGAAGTSALGPGLSPLALGTPTYARDFQFELALLRRVDPADARRVEETVRAELAHR